MAGISDETVDLQVEAPSSVINNLVRYREDIYVPLDVSRCTEGENRVTVGQPVWPTNFNTDEVVLQGKEPGVITVEVDRLYTNTFEVEFQLDGQVADGYQMGTPAIEPESDGERRWRRSARWPGWWPSSPMRTCPSSTPATCP